MEKEKRGISWHAIQRECECEKFETFVHDEYGEDCNAYEEMSKLKSEGLMCPNCGKYYIFRVIKTK